MVETFELTNYNFYSSRLDMELITNIVDTLKEILEEDKKQEQPLFLKVADDFIMNIARKVVQEKKKTFLIGITGESASGKTVFVDNTIEAVVRDKKEGIYTVIRQDDFRWNGRTAGSRTEVDQGRICSQETAGKRRGMG